MPVKWRKVLIADERYESAGVFDVNNDGHLDIVSGAWWYEGPDFKRKHFTGDVRPEGEYFDDFSTIPLDINGDGYTDYVTGGWWGGTLRWRENPGGSGDSNPEEGRPWDTGKGWKEHLIAATGPIETTRGWDVDGDGQIEIVPNTPGGPLVVYKLISGGQFTSHTLYNGRQGHGLGFGDINGDGRGDFVMSHGWLEAPEEGIAGRWTYHPDFKLGSASIPIIVADVNGDGHNDLIVGQAHGYGLSWWEQIVDAEGEGGRTWREHPIDPYNSQYHDLQWVDIDGDGRPELVTGKRYRAHCDGDPGAFDDVGLYYFKWNGESFSKQVIDYGPARVGKGCGIMFAVADLRGSGRLDIVAPGKDGLYVFFNEGLG